MELKWTSKALSDLARLYDFLVLASKPAAARTVQSLTQAPVILLTHRKRLVRTVLIFTESSDQLSRATDRVPGLPASPGYVQ